MKKLLIAAILVMQPLLALEPQSTFQWFPTCYFFDIDTECIFYDAWNDRIEVMIPRDYLKMMYDMEVTAVLTHFHPLPPKPLVRQPINTRE